MKITPKKVFNLHDSCKIYWLFIRQRIDISNCLCLNERKLLQKQKSKKHLNNSIDKINAQHLTGSRWWHSYVISIQINNIWSLASPMLRQIWRRARGQVVPVCSIKSLVLLNVVGRLSSTRCGNLRMQMLRNFGAVNRALSGKAAHQCIYY